MCVCVVCVVLCCVECECDVYIVLVCFLCFSLNSRLFVLLCFCFAHQLNDTRYLEDMAKEQALELIEFEPQGAFVSMRAYMHRTVMHMYISSIGG